MRTALTADQQELAMKYLPLARSLARPFKRSWTTHRDDFESAACGALVEAAGNFDPERGVKFSTFLRHRVWGGLRDAQRSLVAMGFRCDPKCAPKIVTMTDGVWGKGRVIGADRRSPPEAEVDSRDAVEGMLRKLPTAHAQVCRRVYLHDESQHEVATELGLSQSRVSYLHRESLAILNGSWAESVRSEVEC